MSAAAESDKDSISITAILVPSKMTARTGVSLTPAASINNMSGVGTV